MKKIIVIGLVLLLSGCSTKFVYKNLDWLVYWYVDDFVELSDEQERMVDVKLATWLEWHKNTEIPKYVAHLNELSDDIRLQQISLDKMDYHQQKAAEHWTRLKAKIIPDLVEMAQMLTQEQVDSMFKEIDEMNKDEEKERQELLAKSPEQRQKRSIKRNIKNLERWLGDITSEQESLVENMYGQYHSNGELWLEYRVRYQAELRSLFNKSDRGDEFKAKLNRLLMQPEEYRSELLNQRNDENRNSYKTFLLAVDALATDEQRTHLLSEIADFVEDFSDLAK
ncbi:DUF6279 family lipoprotein [Brumicola nitratireducens]|uniref:Lipoprotein n=1 Tax=Glaciecola nitratireducens (strain JCM 12485 / KCTC 12276 / FR1064) TaxID=1085623 RepID=G4QKM5_GLANF|nr:DUF6279 family lipoprotein [Glaciecola nitratireducens]AEP30091.1 hypothetical protein GNIT_1982 [Glaciecola nitratireducens FR1064]